MEDRTTMTCPFCNYSNPNSSQLEEHVNKQHPDVVSPSTTAGLSSNDFNCPICAEKFVKASELEQHVNVAHRAILSPARPNQIQSIEVCPSNNLECPVCTQAFGDSESLQIHVDGHFSSKGSTSLSSSFTADLLLAQEIEKQDKGMQRLEEEQNFELLQAQYGMEDDGDFKKQSLQNMKKEVEANKLSWAEFANRKHDLMLAESNGLDDFTSCTQNLVPAITAACRKCNSIVGVHLCSYVDHYASSYGDKGWGCGYRNTQMLFSSLLQRPGYKDRIHHLWQIAGDKKEVSSLQSAMPSISRLQKHIEWAWSEGFDRQGAGQLGGRVVNTRKWIGATEVTTILSSLRIRCQLVDFHRPSSSNGWHPALFDWVRQYFQSKDDFKPPLYLQHQGHSRTIVGVEQLKDNSVHLLVLDPSHSKPQIEKLRTTGSSVRSLRLLRKTQRDMKAKQYQIVAVRGLIDSEGEYQRSKELRSLRVPEN